MRRGGRRRRAALTAIEIAATLRSAGRSVIDVGTWPALQDRDLYDRHRTTHDTISAFIKTIRGSDRTAPSIVSP